MAEQTTPSKSSSSPMAPGRLRNFVEMTIQTRQAQRLLRGRRGADGKPPIIGLYRYGAMTRTIWTGATHDDPYADWFLLQIEQALTESKDEIETLNQTIQADMRRVSAMQVGLAHSTDPIKVELTFSNPYGYMGGWLLVDLDELVLSALTARHVGLVTREASEKLLDQAGRAVRRAYTHAQRYRTTAVTRKDVREGNRRAQRAKEAMGELPQSVMDGTLRPEHAPAITDLQQATTGGHTVATSDEATKDRAAAEQETKDETSEGVKPDDQ